MIITGCLSVISGVIVAYFHHRHLSFNIPEWVNHLILCFQDRKHKENPANRFQMVSNDVETLEVSSDWDSDNIAETNSSKVKSESKSVSVIDKDKCLVTWKDVALLIDKLLLLTCACLTVISTTVIVICFFVLN